MPADAPRARVDAPPRHDQFLRLPMVEWYHPYRLLLTGLQVLVWEFIGQGRAMEEAPRSYAILAFGKDELWFDFVADAGDGWNSAFAIASLVAEDLVVDGETLEHGAFVLFGGDEVYPVPTQRAYRERFVAPYSAALPPPAPPDRRALLAIPGNHDWYDGLVSFSRQFTQYRSIGGWRTVQAQSYFAVKLPQGWWLWAMDVLPASNMDYGQREYFRAASHRLAPRDRVILVAAQPDWVEEEIRYKEESHFWQIEDELITPRGATVHLWLSGDLHHYRRHEERRPDGTPDTRFQRVTSGGGGAFLFPTHRPARRSVVVGDREFVRKASFPSPVTSFRLSLLNLAFAAKNWKLGVFPMGTLYWLLTWVRLPEGWPSLASWVEVFRSPGLLLWLFVILGGFVVFADGTRRWFRWLGGLAHGAAHVLTASAVTGFINGTWLAGAVTATDLLAANVLNFVAGMIFGPTVLGLYLLLAVNLFGFHAMEAFSSLRIEDYKNFLRLHVRKDGTLEVYPIAVAKVPREDGGHARYHLIEGPVVIRPTASRAGGAAA